MPAACYEKDNDPYMSTLKDFMCSVCQANQPWVTETNKTFTGTFDATKDRSVTLYLCEDFAKKLFSRSERDYKQADLSKPPTAFDKCGYYYLSEEAD
jgi:hypothetical protein